MKLDSYDGECGTDSSVVFKEINPPGGNSSLSDRAGSAEGAKYRAAFDQTLLLQIHKVVDAILLIVPGETVSGTALSRIKISELFEKCSLQLSIQIHMSGLLGLFVWKQKATTDAPDAHMSELQA